LGLTAELIFIKSGRTAIQQYNAVGGGRICHLEKGIKGSSKRLHYISSNERSRARYKGQGSGRIALKGFAPNLGVALRGVPSQSARSQIHQTTLGALPAAAKQRENGFGLTPARTIESLECLAFRRRVEVASRNSRSKRGPLPPGAACHPSRAFFCKAVLHTSRGQDRGAQPLPPSQASGYA
jgi:hypothetical protein